MPPKSRAHQSDASTAKAQHPHQILPQSVRHTNDIGVLRQEFRSCLTDIKSLKQHLREKQVLIEKNSEKLLRLQDGDPESRKAALRTEMIRLAKQIETGKANINRLLAELEWRSKDSESMHGDADSSANTSVSDKAGGNVLQDLDMLRAVRTLLAAQKEKDYYAKKKAIFEDSLAKGAEVHQQDIQKKNQDYISAKKNIEGLRKQRDDNIVVISKLQEELVQAGITPAELQKMYKDIGIPMMDIREDAAGKKTSEQVTVQDGAPSVKQNVNDLMQKANKQYKTDMLSVSAVTAHSAALKEVSLSRTPQQTSPYGDLVVARQPVHAPSKKSSPTVKNPSTQPSTAGTSSSAQEEATAANKKIAIQHITDSIDRSSFHKEAREQPAEAMNHDADIAYSPDRRLKAVVFDPPLPLNGLNTPPRQTDLPPSRGGVGGTAIVDTPSAIDQVELVEGYSAYISQFSPGKGDEYDVVDMKLRKEDIEKAVIEDEIRKEVTRRIDTAKSQRAGDNYDEIYKDDFDHFSDDIDEKIMDTLNSTARQHQSALPEPVERNPDDFDFFA